MSGARRGIVMVRFGARAGDKVVLADGERVTLGRAAPADVQLAGDEDLSALHCEVSFEGGRFYVTDRKSRLGTFLDGARIDGRTAASDGAELRLSRSTIALFLEGHSRPRRVRAADASQAASAALIELGRSNRLFAVLDAARTTRVLELCRESVDVMKSLYEGGPADTMAEAAPYLVSFDPTSALLARVVSEGWGDAWGVFIDSPLPFRELRRQLRRLLMVEIDGVAQPAYFRFYDPRIVRTLWPTCTPRQRAELLCGSQWCVEGERGELLRLSEDSQEGSHAHSS